MAVGWLFLGMIRLTKRQIHRLFDGHRLLDGYVWLLDGYVWLLNGVHMFAQTCQRFGIVDGHVGIVFVAKNGLVQHGL